MRNEGRRLGMDVVGGIKGSGVVVSCQAPVSSSLDDAREAWLVGSGACPSPFDTPFRLYCSISIR